MWFFGRRRARLSAAASPSPAVAAGPADKLERWGDDSQEISVLEQDGGHRVVQVRAKVKMHPSDAYKLLIHEDNWKVFTSQMPPTKRLVVADNGVQQTVDIEQEGRWRFLMFKGTFPVRLRIIQNSNSKTISFELTERRGFMKKFDGEWRIAAFSEQALADTATLEGVKKPAADVMKRRFSSAISDLRQKTGILRSKRDAVALVTMRQSLELAIAPPPGMGHLISKIAGSVMRKTIAEFQQEAINIQKGNPTLTSL